MALRVESRIGETLNHHLTPAFVDDQCFNRKIGPLVMSKVLKPVEFGHKVFLAESAQGLITDYQVLKGNPTDSDHMEASLERHQQTFQHPPEWYAGDRGFYSADNVQRCQQAEAGEVCIPQRGGKKTAEQEVLERSRAFKKAQRFRAALRAASRCCFGVEA